MTTAFLIVLAHQSQIPSDSKATPDQRPDASRCGNAASRKPAPRTGSEPPCCACDVVQSRVSSGYLSMPCNRVHAARRLEKPPPPRIFGKLGPSQARKHLARLSRDANGCNDKSGRHWQGNRLGFPRPSAIFLTWLSGPRQLATRYGPRGRRKCGETCERALPRRSQDSLTHAAPKGCRKGKQIG